MDVTITLDDVEQQLLAANAMNDHPAWDTINRKIETARRGGVVDVIAGEEVDEIAGRMLAAGYDVETTEYEGALAFTAPPASRLMFGRIIADVLTELAGFTDGDVNAMLRAARTTRHPAGRVGTVLYFPGYTAGA
jgi:hypothetical protein